MAQKITVYSTQACSFCIRLKQFLKENNIEFENIDISTNAEKTKEMVERSGQMGVPVIDIDGEIIIGFDKDKITQALGL